MVDRLFGKKVIGIKQCRKAIANGKGKVLYVAQDADIKLVNPLVELAKKNDIKIVPVENMNTLGKMCGIEVKSAATLVLDEVNS